MMKVGIEGAASGVVLRAHRREVCPTRVERREVFCAKLCSLLSALMAAEDGLDLALQERVVLRVA